MRFNKNHKAFSLIELMIIIGIMSVLASIVIANLMGSKQDAKDQKVWELISVTPESAFRCLKRNLSEVYLRRGDSKGAGNTVICGDASDLKIEGVPNWPSLRNTGWSYGDDTTFWCSPGYNGSTPPTSCTPSGTLPLHTCGNGCGCGSSQSGTFCYKISPTGTSCSDSGAKCIWCTENGCQKSGF